MAEPPLDASVVVASYRQLDSTSLALQALFQQETDYSPRDALMVPDTTDYRSKL